MLNKFWPRQYFSYPSIELSFDLCFLYVFVFMYLYLCICKQITNDLLQSLEFIRSSLNSLDVAAEFECARGFCLFVIMFSENKEKKTEFECARGFSFFANVSLENKKKKKGEFCSRFINLSPEDKKKNFARSLFKICFMKKRQRKKE